MTTSPLRSSKKGTTRHRREARLAPVLGVEGRHAHEPVDTPLGGHQPVGVTALDDECGRQDARFLALADVVYLDGEAPALHPALVHAQQHLGPVLGVGTAVLGVHLAHGVQLVVLAREQRPQLQLVELGCSARPSWPPGRPATEPSSSSRASS